MLVKYVSSKKDLCCYYLNTCAFAYNTSLLNICTPSMLMFGRPATLPIDVELERQCPEDLCKTYWELEDPPPPPPPPPPPLLSCCIYRTCTQIGRGQRQHDRCTIEAKETYDKRHCKRGQFQCDQLVLLTYFSR